MSRSNFVYTVALPTGPGGSLVPVPGVGIDVFNWTEGPFGGSIGSEANWYSDRGSSTPGSSVTDEYGNINIWLETGDYNINFQDQQVPPRLNPFTIGFTPTQVTDAVVEAVDNVWFVGDLKWSTQAADHGLNAAGNHTWLLAVNDSDGGGRKVSGATYPGLWNQLGGPTTNPLDADGNFRLPSLSGSVLVAAGTASGEANVSIFQQFGVNSVDLTHQHPLSDEGGAAIWYYESVGTGVGMYICDPASVGPGFTTDRFSSALTFSAVTAAETGGSTPLLGNTDEQTLSVAPYQPSVGMNLFIFAT